jgi:hypothetical protein
MDSSKVATSGASRLAEILTVKANEASKPVKNSNDVDAWIKEQMGPTILAKRRQALGGVEKK